MVDITFDVNITQFRNNYITFLNQIANAVNVAVNNIVILSITSGSVKVNMAVSSLKAAGSNDAVSEQNSL